MIIYRKDPDPYQMIWIRITDWYAKNPFIKKGNYLRQNFWLHGVNNTAEPIAHTFDTNISMKSKSKFKNDLPCHTGAQMG